MGPNLPGGITLLRVLLSIVVQEMDRSDCNKERKRHKNEFLTNGCKEVVNEECFFNISRVACGILQMIIVS